MSSPHDSPHGLVDDRRDRSGNLDNETGHPDNSHPRLDASPKKRTSKHDRQTAQGYAYYDQLSEPPSSSTRHRDRKSGQNSSTTDTSTAPELTMERKAEAKHLLRRANVPPLDVYAPRRGEHSRKGSPLQRSIDGLDSILRSIPTHLHLVRILVPIESVLLKLRVLGEHLSEAEILIMSGCLTTLKNAIDDLEYLAKQEPVARQAATDVRDIEAASLTSEGEGWRIIKGIDDMLKYSDKVWETWALFEQEWFNRETGTSKSAELSLNSVHDEDEVMEMDSSEPISPIFGIMVDLDDRQGPGSNDAGPEG